MRLFVLSSIDSTMSHCFARIGYPLRRELWFTAVISFLFPAILSGVCEVARDETKELAPGWYNRFVSVTFPHPIGILILLQLRAVLLAHVSERA